MWDLVQCTNVSLWTGHQRKRHSTNETFTIRGPSLHECLGPRMFRNRPTFTFVDRPRNIRGGHAPLELSRIDSGSVGVQRIERWTPSFGGKDHQPTNENHHHHQRVYTHLYLHIYTSALVHICTHRTLHCTTALLYTSLHYSTVHNAISALLYTSASALLYTSVLCTHLHYYICTTVHMCITVHMCTTVHICTYHHHQPPPPTCTPPSGRFQLHMT